MLAHLLVLFVGVCLAWEPSPGLGFWEHGLKHEIQPRDNFWIAFEAFPEENRFVIALALNSTGWIGFGPSETGSMIGANPCVIREEPLGSGKMMAIAMHSLQMAEPIVNDVQNCKLIEYNQLSGESYAKIERPMIGCRPEDMDISIEWEMRWIVAYGYDQEFYYHGSRNRFTTEFHVLYGLRPTYEIPPGAQAFDAVLGEAWELPPKRDVYWCRGIELPQDQRYNVFLQQTITYPIAPAVNHHVILYDCPDGIPDEWSDGEPDACLFVGGTAGCMRFWLGWAIGQGDLWFMDHPLAMGAGDGAIRHVYLETHIDNPDPNATAVFDGGWGARLWYLPAYAQEESAVFGLYVGIPLAGIPPKRESYEIEGFCVGGCTRFLPRQGIKITAVSPHLHSAGIGAWVSVVREGKEIGTLFKMNAWDANWQGPRWRTEETYFNVLPGDTLIGHCVYNTTDRTAPIRFGEGYVDEMCMFYINYYPRTDFITCTEWPGRNVEDQDRSVTMTLCSMAPFVAFETNRTYTPIAEPPNYCNA